MSENSTFGERARAFRRRLGLSQQEMARHLCVGRVAISHLENNKRNPSDRTRALMYLAQRFVEENGRAAFVRGWPDNF